MIDIVLADITALDVDAVVTAANSGLVGGGGVDGAIHDAAGPELVAASMRLAPCPAGSAVITPGFALRARYVIHAVGPIWEGGKHGEEELLKQAYERSFELARAHQEIRSIAFPAISTGIYRFPKPLAASIAVAAMRANEKYFDRIIACVFDQAAADLYTRAMSAGQQSA